MMRLRFLLALAGAVCAAAAAAPDAGAAPAAHKNSAYAFGAYKANALVYVYRDNSEVRGEPSDEAKTLGRLAIAQPVRILKKTNAWHEKDGYRDYWYRARGQAKNKKTVTGYVWGGDLAKVALRDDLDGDRQKEWLLVGIAGQGKKNIEKKAEARVVRNGRVRSQVSFRAIETPTDAFFGYTMGGEVLPGRGRGFKNTPKVVRLTFTYNARDHKNGDVLLFFTRDRAEFAAQAMRMSNEYGGITSRCIFPTEKFGLPNHLVVVETAQNKRQKRKHVVNKTLYVWDGKHMRERRS